MPTPAQWFYDRLRELQVREQAVSSLMNSYGAKTAGGLLDNYRNRVIKGWLYANSSMLLFLSDSEPVTLPGLPPVAINPQTILMPLGLPFKLTAPPIIPNGIINFGYDLEFVGQKSRIKQIAKLASEAQHFAEGVS